MDQSTHEIRVREWSQNIQDCNASGLTKKEWCLQNHINEKSFYYWQRVIRREMLTTCQLPVTTDSSVKTTFVELPSPKHSAPVSANDHSAVIRLDNGISIEISESASAAFIRQLIGAAAYAE
ncbi:MAG: hypothetical protein K2I10_03460 [Lachnospiraceae bacterium]|nr:hypothetical protein [Lachnospiraceae bacterium]